MTPKLLACGLFLVLLISAQGCVDILMSRETLRGSGTVAEETFSFTGITGVQLATIGELEIELGDTEELRIEADDNLLEYFEAVMEGDTLRIDMVDGTWRRLLLRPSRSVRYTLTVKDLEFIGLSSTGDAHTATLSADRFEIRVTSTGDLSMDGIDANALEVHVSSTGDVRIGEGVAENQNIRISSTGDYDGASVRSAQTTVRLSSTGDARVWAEESLDATLSSTGSVHYRGDPEVFDNHSSTGRVRRIR